MATIENFSIIERSDAYTEATLTDDNTIVLHVEDAEQAVAPTLTLDEVRALHAALGHLLWIAEHAD